MAKRKINNNLGGNQINYLDNPDVNSGVETDSIETYNVSADNIQVDQLVNSVYQNFENSDDRKLMLEGIEYYNNKSKIDDKKRFDHCGSAGKENTKLSNAKVHKNFMRKMTRQKVTFLLGKMYSIETKDDNYKQILEDRYFTKNMYRLIFNLTKEAIKEGINWINVYYDEKGELKFRRVPGNQVKVFWADREHTEIAQLIHYYEIEIYQGSEVRKATYADYYNNKGVIHYVKEDAGFVRDKERPKEEGNFTLMIPVQETVIDETTGISETKFKLDENGKIIFEPQQMVWDKLPWVPLKYNEEETSLLKYIRSYQDEYEALISAVVDIIKDIPDAIKVFKGYGGANLEELTDLIAQFRGILVDPDGDVDTLETKFDAASSNSILDRLRKDAYEDGAGVDMQSDNTGDKSGVGLKFLYSDLDLDSEELEQELNVFFEWLLFFIDYDIMRIDHKDYSEEEVTFKYQKTMIINESEKIDMINKSRDMIPDSILLPEHPFVDDVSAVEDAIEEEEKEAEEEMNKRIEQFNQQQEAPAGSLIQNPLAAEINTNS